MIKEEGSLYLFLPTWLLNVGLVFWENDYILKSVVLGVFSLSPEVFFFFIKVGEDCTTVITHTVQRFG